MVSGFGFKVQGFGSRVPDSQSSDTSTKESFNLEL